MATTMVDIAETLPRWDLDSIFPGPESPEFREAADSASLAIAELTALFDRHGIGMRPIGPIDTNAITIFDEVVTRYDATLAGALRLDGYLGCLKAADVRDEAAQAAASEWRETLVDLARLAPRFTAWVSTIDIDVIVAGSRIAREHESTLRRLWRDAAQLMDPGEEDLAASLAPSGGTAWMALRDEIMALATARIELDGVTRELALSDIDNLRYQPDRDVRRRGHETAAGARRAMAVPLAAAINGVKGQQLTLARRRGWNEPLDAALAANAIDWGILDALLTAMREALPSYHRYLRAKARLLGVNRLAGYDLMAPVAEPATWSFETSRDLIIEQFTAFSPKLGALARRAFAERWIDAGPRVGKEGGAMCTAIQGDESRILANYLPVFSWTCILAHELGHAYHTFIIAERKRTFLQASPDFGPTTMPMSLAETASTICETIVQRGARTAAASQTEEVALLEEELQSLTLNTFGILPLFEFEQAVFATRAQRDLSPLELEAGMATAWRDVVGDAVDPDTVWSMSWTMGHFFIDNLWFYNFPYAFGALFSLGLLASREAEPDRFLDRFDTLLADSGMREANELAADFGIDLRDSAFWRASLDTFRADVDRYDALSQLIAEPNRYRADPPSEMVSVTKSHNGSDVG
ncbi:MAG TPA: M3 family metallopeptidase [Thermomicrobiales bacterium]|nr:M3 family metallopeptidase [Thermomicrobiales bacterium]